MVQKDRENFGSRIAFIMALAGSAIGLGNIWRFPYMVGEYGGALFVLIYLFCAFFISLPILLSEAVIGKTARSSTYEAMGKLAPGTRWRMLGLLTVLSPFIILSFYSVVGGWSVDYLFRSCVSALDAGSQVSACELFGKVSGTSWETLLTFTVFLGMTALIIILGVKNGIEKFTKVAIPSLFVLIVAIAAYSLTLPGSWEGVRYLVTPDFSKLTSGTFAYALGQSFFSMSLGVGTVLTYSSYMKEDDSIVKSGIWTAVFDSIFAILAGFAIMPAVFSAGLEPGAGPSLVFETIPFILTKMGETAPVLSKAVTVLFFLTILGAALTSSISLYEVVELHLMERRNMSRKKACVVIFMAAWVLGSLCALSFGSLSGVKIFGETIFSFCDIFSSNYLMMLGAFLFSIFAGWKMDKSVVQGQVGKFFYFMIRWMSPVVILVIFVCNLVI